MKKEYDVFGIGNILVDYVTEVDDSFLKKFKLNKGEMNLRSVEEISDLEKRLGFVRRYQGGSAPNVINGLSNLSRICVLGGSVGNDEDGEFVEKGLEEEGTYSAIKLKKGRTGIAMNLVTPDTERTFVVNHGVADNYTKRDLETSYLVNSKYLHFTGYEFESMKKTIKKAVKVAKKNDVKVSFDLGCAGVVSRNKKEIKQFLKNVDIVFANEEEAKALTEKEDFEAANEIKKYCEGIAIVKLGAEGAITVKDVEGCYMPGYKVKAVNTIGAGDGFAAGFLYGLLKDYPLAYCTQLGNFYASRVVEEQSARLRYKIKNIEWLADIHDK